MQEMDKEIWKTRVFQVFNVIENVLPASYSCWKHFFACKYCMEQGFFDFISIPNVITIPKGKLNDIILRWPKNISLNTSGYSVSKVKVPTRFIALLPINLNHSEMITLDNDWVWYVKFGSNLINGFGQRSNKRVQLPTHAAAIIQIKCSNRILVSLDNNGMILFWDTAKITKIEETEIATRHTPFRKIDFESKKIKCFNVGQNMIFILDTNGNIIVWDIYSGEMKAYCPLSSRHAEMVKKAAVCRIKLRKNIIGIGISNGRFIIYEFIKGSRQSKFPYVINFVQCFADSELNNHSYMRAPHAFELLPNGVLTHGEFSDELLFWKFSKSQLPNSLNLNRLKDSKIQIDDLDQVECLKPLLTLSEADIISKYGYQSTIGDIYSAIMDNDETMIMGISGMEITDTRLFIWDFRVERLVDRHFERVFIEDIPAWICYE